MKVRSVQHEMLPETTVDDRSRQAAVVSLRRLLNTQVRPRNVELYEREGRPAWERRHGRAPETAEEIRAAFFESRRYRFWSATHRAAQEMIWIAAGEPVFRDLERLEATAERLVSSPERRGGLELAPAGYVPPGEVADVDIHLQPGGYAMTRSARDVACGALYENGGNVFAFGQGLGKADSKAGAVIRHLEGARPGLKPRRILDLGCSAGGAACHYAAYYPDAEVHAVDIGEAMLRYAHARAESLDVRVFFHQMNAADLRFRDGEFDLVVSHNLLHEIGRDNRRAMMREAFRVCEPGGLVVHQDVPTRFEPTPVRQVERAWDTRFNGEAHWSTYSGDDLLADMGAAGFPPEALEETRLDKVAGPGGWYLVLGRKPG